MPLIYTVSDVHVLAFTVQYTASCLASFASTAHAARILTDNHLFCID